MAGGGGLAGVWLGFTRSATAEPVPIPPIPVAKDGPWARPATPPPFHEPKPAATVPVPVPAPPVTAGDVRAFALPPVPPAGPVVPAAATFPPIPPVPTLETPPPPPALPIPVPVPAAGPAGAMAPPALPPLPAGDRPAVPPAPVLPDLAPSGPTRDARPMPPPPAPAVPPVELPKVPDAAAPADPPKLPPLPPIPMGTPETTPEVVKPAAPLVPPLPTTPPPAVPLPSPGPTVPPPLGLTPPPAPPRATEPIQPVQPIVPAKPVSDLPRGNVGNSVNPDGPAATPGRVAPAVPPIPVPDPVKPPPLPAPADPVEPPLARPTVLDRPKAPEVPFGPSEKSTFPVPPSAPATPPVPTPGDAPMNLKNAATAAALGGALLAPAPARADDKAEIASLRTQVEASNTRLTEIQAQLRTLTDLLNGPRDKQGFPIGATPGLVNDMKAMQDKLDKFERELAQVKAAQQATALRPPAPAAVPVDPRTGRGTVRVVNEYPVQVSIVVNGTSYRVGPQKSLDVDVPAGKFTYQLLESAAAQTESTVAEKETVRLRIR
ncbi:MAG: hypothetical protein C0501_03915 [Isosphaera sp.]|nr:hypothetical protein [Isosphaera sp.]